MACWAAPLLVVAGCAADAEGPAPAVAAAVDVSVAGDPQRTSYPFTIDNCGVPVTFERPPERVLILNGTSVAEVESMLALGLGDRVIANAQSYGVSDEPGMTEKIKPLPTGGLTQNDQFDVPAEQTLAAGADLVLSTWPGGFSAENGFATREQLAAVGANTLVNPVNCAMGRPEASEEEKAAYASASPRSSLEFLVLLGQVFDVQERAYAVARELGDRIAAINAAVVGRPAPKVLVVYPGMSMMNDNGLPAVMAGWIYDAVVEAAGGVNAFPDADADFTRTINAEQLAAAEVDLIAIGAFTPDEVPEQDAQRLFDAFPQWAASRNRAFVTVSDGMYLGTTNVWAIEKIARVAHADRF
jgi:iron complex transport system substrate-binding protein